MQCMIKNFIEIDETRISPGVKVPKIGDRDLSRRPRQKYPILGTNIEKTTQNWANHYDDIPETGEFL